jgi:hypothetical protein
MILTRKSSVQMLALSMGRRSQNCSGQVASYPDSTLSVAQIKQLAETSTAYADTNHQDPESWDLGLDLLPEEYKEFADVFSRKEADKLPPHRHYDHRIPIPEGSVPPFGPMYHHSQVELDALREYISKNLTQGFI